MIVAIILLLNIASSYMSSKVNQENTYERQMQAIAKQIVVTLETLEKNRNTMDIELGIKLRLAAMVAQEKLNPDIEQVTDAQLVALRDELGIDDLTLWQRINGEVISVKSSNPDELGLSSKSWDYWNTAFHQLFNLKKVDIKQGQTLQNFWTGPINYAVSDPTLINKWGYYYDGSTNYMINTIINTDKNFKYDLVNGTNDVIRKLINQQPALLEITGIDPQYFGTAPIIKMKKGVPVHNLDVRAIPFGTYTYKNTAEETAIVQEVVTTGQTITNSHSSNGKQVLRSFIPIIADKHYVISVAFDEQALHEPLKRQLFAHILISLVLVMITLISSYFIAGYMIRSLNQILITVNAIATGNFKATTVIHNNDELGLLATRINTMGANLNKYTTQLKDTANELQSTKQYLESFVNHTSDAIHVIDLQGRIIQVNNAFEAIYGWRRDEVIGHPLPTVPEEYRTAYEDLIHKVITGGSVTDHETTRFTKTGDSIEISITISAIRNEHDAIIAIASISRNITSRKQAEEMIRRSEKLSVVGQLAAGVAHEVRNPLTTLRGFVQHYQRTGSLSPVILDLMLSELDQINMIVSEFLVLAKPQAIRQDCLKINELVGDIVMLMDSEAKLYNVELVVRKLTDIPTIPGVASQLKQVFVNVIKNGLEAMEDGGELIIELKSFDDHEIIICFIDQGKGISEDDLKRIGEPFYSKKEGGNGLGVMICQQIIAIHLGSMHYYSKIGEGTCVEIRLPIPEKSICLPLEEKGVQ
nr:PAS domain S-box protein [Paenibacillus sp. GSMTC-2017]